MRIFFDACVTHKSVNVIKANLVSYTDNIVFLTNVIVTEPAAMAFADYLE